MKHFGNSLSYEEIIEDMKYEQKPTYYTGVQIEKRDVGRYVDGKFIKTGERETERNYSIKFIERNNKWYLWAKDDGGYFDTLEQAKNAARRAFGNGIKWKAQ